MRRTRGPKREPGIRVNLTDDGDAAYLRLPGHRHEPGISARMVRVDLLIPDYVGPMVNLDFDATGRLIGIEVIVFDADKQVPPDSEIKG